MVMTVEKNERYIAREQFLMSEMDKVESQISELKSKLSAEDVNTITDKMELEKQLTALKSELSGYGQEMEIIKKKKFQNLKEALDLAQTKLREQMVEVKAEQVYDGNLKRDIAKILINLMRAHLSGQEIKGVFRQGYKIMRRDTSAN